MSVSELKLLEWIKSTMSACGHDRMPFLSRPVLQYAFSYYNIYNLLNGQNIDT